MASGPALLCPPPRSTRPSAPVPRPRSRRLRPEIAPPSTARRPRTTSTTLGARWRGTGAVAAGSAGPGVAPPGGAAGPTAPSLPYVSGVDPSDRPDDRWHHRDGDGRRLHGCERRPLRLVPCSDLHGRLRHRDPNPEPAVVATPVITPVTSGGTTSAATGSARSPTAERPTLDLPRFSDRPSLRPMGGFPRQGLRRRRDPRHRTPGPCWMRRRPQAAWRAVGAQMVWAWDARRHLLPRRSDPCAPLSGRHPQGPQAVEAH